MGSDVQKRRLRRGGEPNWFMVYLDLRFRAHPPSRCGNQTPAPSCEPVLHDRTRRPYGTTRVDPMEADSTLSERVMSKCLLSLTNDQVFCFLLHRQSQTSKRMLCDGKRTLQHEQGPYSVNV